MKRILIVAFVLPALVACGANRQAELPTVTVRCVSENGLAGVPFNHAVVEIQGESQADLWLEAAVVSGEREERHLLVHFGSQGHYSDQYDGWFGDLRGETGNHILLAGEEYVLRGFLTHGENYPDPLQAEPLFEVEFSVPSCTS